MGKMCNFLNRKAIDLHVPIFDPDKDLSLNSGRNWFIKSTPDRQPHQVPAAQHGHAVAEGGGAGMEGPHRAEGGLAEPVPVRSARPDSSKGENSQ
jgi:hypothetical protein